MGPKERKVNEEERADAVKARAAGYGLGEPLPWQELMPLNE